METTTTYVSEGRIEEIRVEGFKPAAQAELGIAAASGAPAPQAAGAQKELRTPSGRPIRVVGGR